jgi:hypothetical protein
MRKGIFRILLIGSLLCSYLLVPSVAYAQDGEELPDPGITPDSPFYFFDNWGKSFRLFFTTDSEAKAELALEYAGERLAEAQAMAERNNVRDLERATQEYNKFLHMVNQRLEDPNNPDISDNLSGRIALATNTYLGILEQLQNQVSDNTSGTVISDAMNASVEGQVNALRAIAKNKPEQALDIVLANMERKLERVENRVQTANVTDEELGSDIANALDYTGRILEIQNEIAAIAQEKGIDVDQLEQRLSQSTETRLQALSEVYDKAPENARSAIENAIENSVRKYERALESLSDNSTSTMHSNALEALQRVRTQLEERANSGNFSGNVTQALSRIQAIIQEKVMDRLQISANVSGNVSIETQMVQENNQEKNQNKTSSKK